MSARKARMAALEAARPQYWRHEDWLDHMAGNGSRSPIPTPTDQLKQLEGKQ